MRAAALLTLAVALTGCASSVPRRVEVPVGVPCRVAMPARPVWATSTLPNGAGIWAQAKALLSERKQREAYEMKLEAAVKACQ